LAFVSTGRVYLNYQVIRGSTHRIIGLLGQVPLSKGGLRGLSNFKLKGKIEFNNVTFGYNAGTDVLKNLSFSAEPGSWLLVTGPSGCGKSTIANLLLGFYICNSGDILIDDKTINDYDIYELRKQIGYYAQDPVIFHGSIK